MTGRLEYRLTRGDDTTLVTSEWDSGTIVDPPLWHAAQAKPTTRRPARSKEPWLLTGLAVCGHCDYNLKPHRGNGGKYRFYICTNRKCPAKMVDRSKNGTYKLKDGTVRPKRGPGPALDRAPADKLETWTRDNLFQLLGSRVASREEQPDLAPLETAVETAQRRYDQVRAPEARDALGADWAADVKARREELEGALAALGKAQAEAPEPASEETDLREQWETMTPPERREAISLYGVQRITVESSKPDGWSITWR
jgi:hypothetical protein